MIKKNSTKERLFEIIDRVAPSSMMTKKLNEWGDENPPDYDNNPRNFDTPSFDTPNDGEKLPLKTTRMDDNPNWNNNTTNETWTDGTNYQPETPGMWEMIEDKLKTTTAIGVADVNNQQSYTKLAARNLAFKGEDDDNVYFYFNDDGAGKDEEGQPSYSEPKSGVLTVPKQSVTGYVEPNVLLIDKEDQEVEYMRLWQELHQILKFPN